MEKNIFTDFNKDNFKLMKRNVPFNQLKEELKKITNTSLNKMELKYYKPFKEMKKPCYRFRIYENKLRIRDFSFFNFKIVTENDIVEFQFTNKGEERNHVLFSDECDIYIDTKSCFISIDVHGYVWYKDGTRKYQNRRSDM